MKKESIISLLIYLLILAVAVVYGLTVLQPHYEDSAMTAVWQYAIYIVLSIVAGILISAVLFEFGHLLGAKVAGYKIVSFNLLYFAIYKDGEKTKAGFKSFDGLTGETVIVPNYEKNNNPNPLPFLLYGPIFNLAWLVGCLIIFFTYNHGTKLDGDIAYGFLTAGIIAGVLFIYDIIPTKLDSLTDGYRISLLAKNKNKKAFNDMLVVQYNSTHGDQKISEEIKVDESTTYVAETNLAKLYKLIDEKKFDEAKEMLQKVFEEEATISKKNMLEAEEQRIYINIMTMDEETLSQYYEKEVPMSLKREISNDSTMLGIRTYILMAGLLDKSRSECIIALNKLNKAYKSLPKNRKGPELILFNEALEKVCQAHPKWELEIYKLYE